MEKRSRINASLLEPKEILKRFYNSLSEEDKGRYNIKQIEEIISSPFACMKKDLKEDKLYIYRLQFLGTFYTTLNKAKYHLKDVTKGFKEGRIPEKRFNEIKNMIDDFIKRKS